jgi:hypothetical protein
MGPKAGTQFISSAVLVAAVLLGATACTFNDTPAAPLASEAPTQSPSPTAVTLSCDELLPIEQAAQAVGVPADSLSVLQGEGDAAGSSGAVGAAMAFAARAAAGEIDCVRRQADAGDSRAAGIRLSVLPGGADAFAMIEPDVNDGLGGFESIAVGDAGYVVCNDGESDSCRIEATSGGTWFSLSVSPRPADTAALSTLANTVAAMVGDLSQPHPAVDPVGCDELTDVDALRATALPVPVTDDYLTLDERASLPLAAERHGTIAFCAWTSAGSSGGVSVHAIPIGEAVPASGPTGGAQSSIPLEPLAGFGQNAVSGCSNGVCEIDVLGDDVWMVVQAFGAAADDVDALHALAAGLLARLEA